MGKQLEKSFNTMYEGFFSLISKIICGICKYILFRNFVTSFVTTLIIIYFAVKNKDVWLDNLNNFYHWMKGGMR